MSISDTRKLLKSSHCARSSRSLCLGTSDSHFYSNARMQRNKGPVTSPWSTRQGLPCLRPMWENVGPPFAGTCQHNPLWLCPATPSLSNSRNHFWTGVGNHPTRSNSLSSELTWASVLEIQNTILCCNIPSLTQTPDKPRRGSQAQTKYKEGGLTS